MNTETHSATPRTRPPPPSTVQAESNGPPQCAPDGTQPGEGSEGRQRPREGRARPSQRTFRTWLPALGLVLICVALALGGEPVRLWARYEREALEAGQLWRLVTGHLVHLGLDHLLLDLSALILIRLVVGSALSAAAWIGAMLVTMAAIDTGLYFGASDIDWYVGLSGVLHGLLAAGAFALLGTDRRFAVLLLAGIAAKLAWEQTVGPLPWSAEATGGPVITAAHLYGAIGGTLFAGAAALVRGRRGRPL